MRLMHAPVLRAARGDGALVSAVRPRCMFHLRRTACARVLRQDARRAVWASAEKAQAQRLLVLNAGSSSLKFKAFTLGEAAGEAEPGIGGIFERIGDPEHSGLVAKGGQADPDTGTRQKWELALPAADHVQAMSAILAFLQEHMSQDMAREVVAVGHRVVHGLDINQPVRLDAAVLDTIRKAQVLAPLHNGAALQGISAASEIFGATPQVWTARQACSEGH